MKLFTPKTRSTPIPVEAQFETQINNVAGTKVERIKQPDGTYAIVESLLPDPPEAAALKARLQQIQTEQLDWINKLSSSNDIDDIAGLREYLDDYRTTQNINIDAAANEAATGQERVLARFGQADSTAAAEGRTGLAQGVLAQKAQLGRDISALAEDRRNTELNRAGTLYNLTTGALDSQKATQLGALTTSLNSGYQGQQTRQAYNNSVSATIGANNALKTQASQAGLSNLAAFMQILTDGAKKGFQAYGGGA